MGNTEDLPIHRVQAAFDLEFARRAMGLAMLLTVLKAEDPTPPGVGMYASPRLPLTALLVLVAYRILREGLRAKRGGSVLEVYQFGFACPGRFSGVIAWRDIARMTSRGASTALVRLRPETADRLPWQGCEGLVRRLAGLQRTAIGLPASSANLEGYVRSAAQRWGCRRADLT